MIVHADTNDIAKEKNLLDNIKKIVKQGGLRPLQPPVPLPATRRAQRVNDEPVKVLNLLFFVYFIFEMRWKFQKTAFFHFWAKAMLFYLTHSAQEYFEKLAFKKQNKRRNFKRLYLKRQGEFRVKTNIFRKLIHFSLKSLVFCTLYRRGYTAGGFAPYNPRCLCQRFAGLKELMMSQ